MSVPVEVCTLDEILTNEEPFALKLDVEGYELPALVGARAVLGRSSLRVVIIELNGSGRRYGHDEARTAELLMEHGFRPFIYKPSSRALLPLERVERSEGNVLFLRDPEEIRRRLDTAPAVHIGGRIILSEAEFPVRTGNPVNAIASA